VDQWRRSRKRLNEYPLKTAFFERKNGEISVINLPVFQNIHNLPDVVAKEYKDGDMPDVAKMISFRIKARGEVGAIYEEIP
jgi:hypothetical protein